MNKIKFTLIVLFFLALTGGGAIAKDGWYNNFDKAKAVSLESGRPIFVLFTGGEWCPFCIWLENKILLKDSFLDFSESNLVLMIIDLSMDKDSWSAHNKQMVTQYGIENIPEIIMTDSNGNELKRIKLDIIISKHDDPQRFIKFLKTIITAKGM